MNSAVARSLKVCKPVKNLRWHIQEFGCIAATESSPHQRWSWEFVSILAFNLRSQQTLQSLSIWLQCHFHGRRSSDHLVNSISARLRHGLIGPQNQDEQFLLDLLSIFSPTKFQVGSQRNAEIFRCCAMAFGNSLMQLEKNSLGERVCGISRLE